MSHAKSHIIRKETVLLRMTDAGHSFELQKKAERILLQEATAQLDKIFSEAVPENEVVKIDKVLLDLGKIDEENFSQEFRGKFLSAIKDALVEKVRAAEVYQTSLQQQVQRVRVTDALHHFLQHGVFPGWWIIQSWDDFEEEVLEEIQKNHETFAGSFFALIKNEWTLQRFLFQFSVSARRGIIESLTMRRDKIFSLFGFFEEQYKEEKISTSVPDQFVFVFWNEIFEWISISSGSQGMETMPFPVMEKIIRSFLGTVIGEKRNALLRKLKIEFLTGMEKDQPVRELNAEFLTGIEKDQSMPGLKIPGAMVEIIQQVILKIWKEPQQEITEELGKIEHKNSLVKKITEELAKIEHKDSPVKKNEENSTYINNCGLVLLHPFIPILFKTLNLLDEQERLKEEGRGKAALLLQYLCTGEDETHEYELALNKILCGIPMEEPLPAEIKLSAEEKKEADLLLLAVIQHWNALMNTSPDGLRNSFLMRNGKLSARENGWLLQVEQKTEDILLNRLPWGISMIRFRWMPDLLTVEWDS